MSTRTRFEKEAKGNSEMAYCQGSFASFPCSCSVLEDELFHYVVVASFTASTLLFYHIVFFAFLSSSMSSLTRSAAKHFRVLRG